VMLSPPVEGISITVCASVPTWLLLCDAGHNNGRLLTYCGTFRNHGVRLQNGRRSLVTSVRLAQQPRLLLVWGMASGISYRTGRHSIDAHSGSEGKARRLGINSHGCKVPIMYSACIVIQSIGWSTYYCGTYWNPI
jgi:hypothetical protein